MSKQMSDHTQVVGGYELDLYCQNLQECRSEFSFSGRNKTSATRQAKQAGWRVNWQKRMAKCPECVKKEQTK